MGAIIPLDEAVTARGPRGLTMGLQWNYLQVTPFSRHAGLRATVLSLPVGSQVLTHAHDKATSFDLVQHGSKKLPTPVISTPVWS